MNTTVIRFSVFIVLFHIMTFYSIGAKEPGDSAVFIKEMNLKDVTVNPIIYIAGGLHYEQLSERKLSSSTSKPDKVTYVEKIVYFGVRGNIGKNIFFHSEIGYEMGYSSEPTISHGPMGTGVWEGTASMTIRDNYVKYKNSLFAIAAGVITDPGSVDFLPLHAGGLLYEDPHTRVVYEYTGYNRGQGVMVQAHPWEKLGLGFLKGLSLNYSYTAGNPDSHSGSFIIKNAFPVFFTTYTAEDNPNAVTRYPTDDVYSEVHNPSLVYKHDFFEFYGALQFFEADVYADNDKNKRYKAYNIRGGAKVIIPVKAMKGKVIPFWCGNMAKVRTVEFPPDGVPKDYGDKIIRIFTWHSGVDINVLGNHGIGFWYFWTRERGYSTVSPQKEVNYYRTIYNISASYYINSYTDVSIRYGWYKYESDISNYSTNTYNKSFYAVMRLQI